MRPRLLPAVATAALTASALAFGPAVATPAPACDDAGREYLTTDGLELDLAAPGVTAPELAATADVTGDAITPHRTAHYAFIVDAPQHEQVEIETTLTWDDDDNHPSDYDLYTYSETMGFRYGVGTSNNANIESGDTRIEQVKTTLTDCAVFEVEVRAWAGSPAQTLNLDIDVTPVGEADESVQPRTDERIELYLAGDRPGNLTPPADTAGADYPFGATFSEDRPTANMPNATTRPVVGSTIAKNPFQPWWAGQLGDFPTISGAPSALLWLSSPTQEQDPGTVYVQLFLNGTEHTVEIPGSELTQDVQPFIVEFPEVDTQVFDFSLQVSALPVASPNTASEHLGDANHTVWFDSVQYPSRLFLPVATTD